MSVPCDVNDSRWQGTFVVGLAVLMFAGCADRDTCPCCPPSLRHRRLPAAHGAQSQTLGRLRSRARGGVREVEADDMEIREPRCPTGGRCCRCGTSELSKPARSPAVVDAVGTRDNERRSCGSRRTAIRQAPVVASTLRAMLKIQTRASRDSRSIPWPWRGTAQHPNAPPVEWLICPWLGSLRTGGSIGSSAPMRGVF